MKSKAGLFEFEIAQAVLETSNLVLSGFSRILRVSKPSLGFALPLVLAIGGIGSQSAAAQVPGQLSEQFFKNIQVLKGEPAELMVPSMLFMEISLGVHCVYCHDVDNTKPELDTKPMKAIARQMIQMVADLNKSAFKGRPAVTCYTCHRGHTRPDTILPYNDEDGELLLPGGDADARPTVDQILAGNVAVMGGDTLAKVTTRYAKGTRANLGHIDQVHPERTVAVVTPIEIYSKASDKRLVVAHNQAGDALNSYNAAGGWIKAGATDARDMRGYELDIARLENAVIAPANFSTILQNPRVVGEERVNGRSTWVVRGRMQALPSVKLYFDKDSGMLLSMAYQQQSYYCCQQFRIDYSDYTVIDGVRMPLKWTMNGPRQNILVFQLDGVTVNSAIDDSRFAKPAPASAAR